MAIYVYAVVLYAVPAAVYVVVDANYHCDAAVEVAVVYYLAVAAPSFLFLASVASALIAVVEYAAAAVPREAVNTALRELSDGHPIW